MVVLHAFPFFDDLVTHDSGERETINGVPTSLLDLLPWGHDVTHSGQRDTASLNPLRIPFLAFHESSGGALAPSQLLHMDAGCPFAGAARILGHRAKRYMPRRACFEKTSSCSTRYRCLPPSIPLGDVSKELDARPDRHRRQVRPRQRNSYGGQCKRIRIGHRQRQEFGLEFAFEIQQ
jgi:hypothetical protein